VRGEAVMPLAAFARMNEEREREGLRRRSIRATPPRDAAHAGFKDRRQPAARFYAYFLLVEGEYWPQGQRPRWMR
jgi:NAD-dependent DNA ligase